MRRFNANTTLIFLGSCLLFAEGALGVIAAVTDVNPTLLATFALIALGMVLTALVIMYLHDPAFLTMSGQQTHDLKRLEIIVQSFDDRELSMYMDDLLSIPPRDSRRSGMAEGIQSTAETEELGREQGSFLGET